MNPKRDTGTEEITLYELFCFTLIMSDIGVVFSSMAKDLSGYNTYMYRSVILNVLIQYFCGENLHLWV